MLTHNKFEQKFREGKKACHKSAQIEPPKNIMTARRMQEPSWHTIKKDFRRQDPWLIEVVLLVKGCFRHYHRILRRVLALIVMTSGEKLPIRNLKFFNGFYQMEKNRHRRGIIYKFLNGTQEIYSKPKLGTTSLWLMQWSNGHRTPLLLALIFTNLCTLWTCALNRLI